MAKRLTLRKLNAMDCALSAMMAGQEGEGDWPEDLSYCDLDDAHAWICQEISKREATQ